MVTSISISEHYIVRKKSAGPRLGSQGYPRKVTSRRMAQFKSVRYRSAPNQGSWIQWWCLFHYQNYAVSKKKSAGPRLGSQGYPRKVTLHRMAQFISVRYKSALNQGSQSQCWCLFHYQNITVSEKKSVMSFISHTYKLSHSTQSDLPRVPLGP